VITDIANGREHNVLNGLHPDQGMCRIYDSPLSEAGVMGFEFGYSLDFPDALVMWEAQFGDFANGAQVIIDQFITSSEDKWKRLSGITLLLPHGYEGQGPEHSSARLERYLQSCAEHNIQVAQPTTPAQMYHLLRGQVLRRLRKPLIVMTPKSLLRLPAATSSLDELATGTFHRVLHDDVVDPAKVTRVLLCTGKIYYDLADERTRASAEHVAIVRLEKLYPWWPHLVAAATTDKYPNLKECFWVQDEPSNMGAGPFVTPRIEAVLRQRGGIACDRAAADHESCLRCEVADGLDRVLPRRDAHARPEGSRVLEDPRRPVDEQARRRLGELLVGGPRREAGRGVVR
jgi:2-oxoglutarate dehydrogenase E1 component